MRVERDGLVVELLAEGAVALGRGSERPMGFSADEARWLMVAALPAILANEPADDPEPVIEGQTTIDEALTAGA